MKSAFRSITFHFVSIAAQNVPKRSFARAVRSNLLKRSKETFVKDSDAQVDISQTDSLARQSENGKTQQRHQNVNSLNLNKTELKKSGKKKLQLLQEFENDPDQSYILTCKTTNELLEVYKNNKHELKLSHFVTMLYQLAKLRVKEQLTTQLLLKDQRALELIEHIKLNFEKLDVAAEATLFLSMVKLNLEDSILFGKAIKGLKQRDPPLSEASSSYILSTFARQRVKDEEYLNWTAKKLLEKVISVLPHKGTNFSSYFTQK